MDQNRKMLETPNSTTVKVINFVAIKVKGAESTKKVVTSVSTQKYMNHIPESNVSLTSRKVCQVEKRTTRQDKMRDGPVQHNPKTTTVRHAVCEMISMHQNNVIWEESKDDVAVISNDIALKANQKIRVHSRGAFQEGNNKHDDGQSSDVAKIVRKRTIN